MNIHLEKHYLQNQTNKIMRIYYYLLFRLYTQLTNPKNQKSEKTAIFITTTNSMFLVLFSLITIFFYLNFYKIIDVSIPNKSMIIILMLFIGLLNYWFFIKDKKFLNFGFKTDKKGGYAIIGFIVFLALAFVFIANKNREKIFKEREKTRIENKQ